MTAATSSTPASLVLVTLYTYPELVSCAVGFCILIVVAIAGNSLVLVAVARTKKLQNVTNVFVVNLSASDCLSSLAFLWNVPGMVSTTTGYPIQSTVPCVTAAALIYIGVGCALYTLAYIALNRCILITTPMKTYQWLYTPKKIALMVLGSWLVPLCAIIIPPLSGIGGLGFDPESRTCNDVDSHQKAVAYDQIQFASLYPIPLIIIVVSYALILRHVRRHFKKRRQDVIMLQPLSEGSGSPTKQDCRSTTPRAEISRQLTLTRTRNDQLAITKNLFLVFLAFVVCFTPLATMVITKSNRYQLYGGLMLFVSSCINPFIYASKHPHFRPVLRSMVDCLWLKNKPHQDAVDPV